MYGFTWNPEVLTRVLLFCYYFVGVSKTGLVPFGPMIWLLGMTKVDYFLLTRCSNWLRILCSIIWLCYRLELLLVISYSAVVLVIALTPMLNELDLRSEALLFFGSNVTLVVSFCKFRPTKDFELGNLPVVLFRISSELFSCTTFSYSWLPTETRGGTGPCFDCGSLVVLFEES